MKRISYRKLGLLGALYFAQGLPYGFQAKALPIYLRASGVDVMTISVLEVLALPWLLKALWAPVVDRYGSERLGRRKSWIIPMQVGLVLTCAVAAFVPIQGHLPLLLGLVFLMNLFAATQDIAVDGFAVDLLEPHELGGGNSAQVMGYKFGMLTAGGLLVWMIELIHWQGLFLAMGALSLLVLGVVLLTREPRRVEEGTNGKRLSWAELREQFRAALLLPGTGWMLFFIGTYKLGETMVDVLFKLFLIDAHFSASQIGQWVGTWGTVASLLGSAAGGVLATRMPLLGALALASCLRVFPLGWEWWLALHGPTEAGVITATIAEHFFGGVLTTTVFAFMMSRVDRRIGATHYTLLASVEVFGKAPSGPLAGFLYSKLGWSYAEVFLLGAVLSVAFVGLLLPLRRRASAPLSTAPTV
ncbi:MFS transporter [Archangium lansingense]|uniref:MFS transporter n=1 Tax=Archangium lansingense TaxID=2995310 RepID=A0ABT4AEE2_9BACT|nr:MFS transporter [Archangium lansinium]MCY1080048.1 MFS transporter [Archangium lansinium]